MTLATTPAPIELLSFTLAYFHTLSPQAQKTHTLSALPPYLTDKVAPLWVIDVLIEFGNALPEEIINMLQAERFQSIFGLPPPLSPPQLYRY